MTTKQAHRIAWYVYVGSERVRRSAMMRGTWSGDVECLCGWKTKTGGATTGYLRDQVYIHKIVNV